jgi:hypothetical protein
MQTINEVAQQKSQIEQLLLESEGEITPDIALRLEQLELDFKSKLKYYLDKHLTEKSIAEELQKKKELVLRRLASKKSSIDFWESRIDQLLTFNDYKKLDIDIYSLSYRKSEQLIIDNADIVPKQYFNEPAPPEVNKINAKRDIKLGIPVPGCYIKSIENLQIK